MKIIYVLSLSFLLIVNISAQIPCTISYQGILTDISGNLKPDGKYTITFNLYETETGGDAVWKETKTLTLSKGLFSTSLGDRNLCFLK
jgi:hypothetical protein